MLYIINLNLKSRGGKEEEEEKEEEETGELHMCMRVVITITIHNPLYICILFSRSL